MRATTSYAPRLSSRDSAPAGSLAGVSGFQIHFSSLPIYTPGDQLDTLVVMNPGGPQNNLPDLQLGGVLIVNGDAFQLAELQKAGYSTNPLEDGSLKAYRVVVVPMTTLNRGAVAKGQAQPT